MKTKIKTFAILTLFVLGFFNFPIYAYAANSDIVISEIGAYETSDYEWLEIYNKGNEAIDLTGWKFYEDQTNHRLSAFQNDLIIDPKEFAIIANKADLFKQKYADFTGAILDSSWSSLKESGEEIGLKNSQGEIIEDFTYLACANTSLQRIDLNLNDYTENNWQAHETSNSAGKANEFPNQLPPDNPPPDEPTPPDSPPPTDNPPPDDNPPADNPPPDNLLPDNTNSPAASSSPRSIYPGSIVINEFVSDPADGEVEWIELYNKNFLAIDLSGWKIIDGSGAETILNGTLGPFGNDNFFVVENPKGKLNNAGDAIILKDKNNNIIDQVYYGNWDNGSPEQNAQAAKDPNSTARIFDGAQTFNNQNDFVITQTPTKGGPNLITLTEEDKKEKEQTAADGSTKLTMTAAQNIIINEIYPNPPGSDLENEFIELKNIGPEPLDLAGWQIQDNSKKKYKISSQDFSTTIIQPNEFFVIERKISGLALNNDKETIKLFSPEDKTIQTVKYSEDENVPENVSFARNENNDFFWSTTPTKNQGNIITKLNHEPIIDINCPKEALINEIITCDASDSYDLEDDALTFMWQIENQPYQDVIIQHQFKQKGTFDITLSVSDGQAQSIEKQKIKITDFQETAKTVKSATVKPTKTSSPKTNYFITTELSKVKGFEIGTKVKTKGVVSVLPQTFGKTIMYLAGSGIQLYLSKANWPNLKIGDLLEVSGTLSESLGEKRIKLSSNQDVKIVGNQAPPEPKIIKISEIGEDLEGYLVKIAGKLIEKNGQKFYVQDETGEAAVYLKQNAKINKNNFTEGDDLQITGIVSQNNDLYQILPRSDEDIKKEEILAPTKQTNVPANNAGKMIFKYLIAGAIFLALILIAVLYQKKKAPGDSNP